MNIGYAIDSLRKTAREYDRSIEITLAQFKALESLSRSLERTGAETIRAGRGVNWKWDETQFYWNEFAQDELQEAIGAQAEMQLERGATRGVWIDLQRAFLEATGDEQFKPYWYKDSEATDRIQNERTQPFRKEEAASVAIDVTTESPGNMRTELWTAATARHVENTSRFAFVDKILKEYARNRYYEPTSRLYSARINGELVGVAYTRHREGGSTFIDGIGSLETGQGVGSALLDRIQADSPHGVIGDAWPGSEGFWSGRGLLQDDGKRVMGDRTQYERVTATDGATGKKMTKFIRILSESDRFLSGVVIDKYGDEVTPSGFDETQWVIEKSTIQKRVPYYMDNFYAELCPTFVLPGQ